MTDEPISDQADAIAAALVAGDSERYRALVESMTDAETAASRRPVVDALLKLTGERQEKLMDALRAAGADYDKLERVIESMSQQERDLVITHAILRAAFLEEQVLQDLDLEVEMLDLSTSDGPFLLKTDEELLRVVRACMRRAFTELPYTSENGPLQPLLGDPDESEADLETLLAGAEKVADAELLRRRFTGVVLDTRWTPKLGRKTHASVIPSDSSYRSYTYGEAKCEALCGRGWGHVPPLQLLLDEVDCPGCRNALMLGGFIRPEEQTHVTPGPEE